MNTKMFTSITNKGIRMSSKIYEESVYVPSSHTNHVFHMLKRSGLVGSGNHLRPIHLKPSKVVLYKMPTSSDSNHRCGMYSMYNLGVKNNTWGAIRMSGPYRIFQNYNRYNVNNLMFGSWRDTIGLDKAHPRAPHPDPTQ